MPACVAVFYVLLGPKRWRAARTYWGALVSIVLSGYWKGCSMTKFGPSHDAGHHIRCHGRAAWRTASATALKAVAEVQASFHDLTRSYREGVLGSHGNHIPSKVRDCGALMFWVPRFLAESELTVASEIWTGVDHFIQIVSAYVEHQVDAFEWPDTANLS